jgi:hypothetical protein
MLRRAKKKAGVAPRPEPARSSGGRGGDADQHHKAAAILGGGTSRGARKTAVSMTGHPAARHALPSPPAPARIIVDDPAIVPELRAIFPPP